MNTRPLWFHFIAQLNFVFVHCKNNLDFLTCSKQLLTNLSFSPLFSVLLTVLQRLQEQIVTCDGLLPSPYLQSEPVTSFQFYSYLEKHHITSLEKHLGKLAKEGNGSARLLRLDSQAQLWAVGTTRNTLSEQKTAQPRH